MDTIHNVPNDTHVGSNIADLTFESMDAIRNTVRVVPNGIDAVQNTIDHVWATVDVVQSSTHGVWTTIDTVENLIGGVKAAFPIFPPLPGG